MENLAVFRKLFLPAKLFVEITNFFHRSPLSNVQIQKREGKKGNNYDSLGIVADKPHPEFGNSNCGKKC